MTNGRKCFSGVGTRHVYGWVFITWFITAVGVTVSEDLKLHAISQVEAQCGGNVTLTCEVTRTNQLQMSLFDWVNKNITCKYGESHRDPDVLCENSSDASRHRLSLTLLKVMPVDQGDYTCKVRSKMGIKSQKTVVTVKDCIGSYNHSLDKSQATCWFSGVYPSGSIHWTQGDVNFTESATSQEEQDEHGRYNVSSTIDLQKGNQTQPYKCSLWIQSEGKYIRSQDLVTSKRQVSAGSVTQLQWFLIMVEVMVLNGVA